VPRLIVFTHADQILRSGRSAQFRCAPGDASQFGARLGEKIVVADISPNVLGGYVALGILGTFGSRQTDASMVQVDNLTIFQPEIPFPEERPDTIGMAEIDEAALDRIATASLMSADEAGFAYDTTGSVDLFSEHLSRQQQRRCSFSDVTTHKGQAVIIRPLDQGGIWQIGNFLFLDPEPGKLFSSFAWTVGPRLEILIDAYAVTPDIADTVNRSGMLAITDKAITTLDRTALAWHREQFFSRLRG